MRTKRFQVSEIVGFKRGQYYINDFAIEVEFKATSDDLDDKLIQVSVDEMLKMKFMAFTDVYKREIKSSYRPYRTIIITFEFDDFTLHYKFKELTSKQLKMRF